MPEIPTIQIDRNKHCEECDGRGVLPTYGKCMKCLEEDFKSGNKKAADHLPDFWPGPREIEETASRLISDHHEEAANARICYLFRKKHVKVGGQVRAGSCAKQSGKSKLLNGFDYVIDIAWDLWVFMEEHQREALILHELCHVFKDGEAAPSWKIEPHNVQEFTKVIEVYGLWQPNLEAMAAAIEKHQAEFGMPKQMGIQFARGNGGAEAAATGAVN